jgi:hypothetical protein
MNKRSHLNLFEKLAVQNPIYTFIRDEQAIWHKGAKYYWHAVYNRYHQYLDDDFVKKFPQEFFARLWELTMIHFLGTQQSKSTLQLCDVGGTRKDSKPDLTPLPLYLPININIKSIMKMIRSPNQ